MVFLAAGVCLCGAARAAAAYSAFQTDGVNAPRSRECCSCGRRPGLRRWGAGSRASPPAVDGAGGPD